MEIINKEKLCDLCKEPANTICFDCSFYLCESCKEFLHNKKSNIQHKKENISSIIPMPLKCEKHPKIPISKFSKETKSK